MKATDLVEKINRLISIYGDNEIISFRSSMGDFVNYDGQIEAGEADGISVSYTNKPEKVNVFIL